MPCVTLIELLHIPKLACRNAHLGIAFLQVRRESPNHTVAIAAFNLPVVKDFSYLPICGRRMTVHLSGYFRPRMLNYRDSVSQYFWIVVQLPMSHERVFFILFHCYYFYVSARPNGQFFHFLCVGLFLGLVVLPNSFLVCAGKRQWLSPFVWWQWLPPWIYKVANVLMTLWQHKFCMYEPIKSQRSKLRMIVVRRLPSRLVAFFGIRSVVA